MAQIPKNLPLAAPSNVTSGRLSGGPRSVASSNSTPIEEASPNGGVLFNDALLFQDREAENQRSRGRSQGDSPAVYAATTQTFAAIFEGDPSAASSENIKMVRSKGFANVVARAIQIYENNVQTVQGTAVQRGSTLSLTL